MFKNCFQHDLTKTNQILYESTVGQDLVLNCAIDANPQERFRIDACIFHTTLILLVRNAILKTSI